MPELAQRLGVAVTSVSSLERNEALGTAKAETVRRALAAMGKEPVIVVVDAVTPAEAATIEARARREASARAEEGRSEGRPLTSEGIEQIVSRSIVTQRLGT